MVGSVSQTQLFAENVATTPTGVAPTERELAGLCVALGAIDDPRLSADERRLVAAATASDSPEVERVRARILGGIDVLGDMFCSIRPAVRRRERGAVYTPARLIEGMLGMVDASPAPDRILDPGAGSGRFLAAAAVRFPRSSLFAVENDPLATLMLRANAHVLGWADRLTVLTDDFTSCAIPPIDGVTLWIGNPPYVRHHDIDGVAKARMARTARDLGVAVNGLAGLHVYFLASIAHHASHGDQGVIVTSAEWMDVGYGAMVRDLLVRRLGLVRLLRVHPAAMPFGEAATTATVMKFRVGAIPETVEIADVDDLVRFHRPSRRTRVTRRELRESPRWSVLGRTAPGVPSGHVRLGDLFRIHRGQVTGANGVWVVPPDFQRLPKALLRPTVTRARELFASNGVLECVESLRRVIDLPPDLDELDAETRQVVEEFLAKARGLGADRGYVATHRRAWWAVGLRDPAPILATYMARRPPAFVLNPHGARHINIAHGLYPRVELSTRQMVDLVRHLSTNVDQSGGRTYAGGLVKFEPREMEALPVPDPFRDAAAIR